MTIFSKGTQNGRFWPKCKGGTLCKFSKWPIFLAELRKLQKIGNTSPSLALLVCMDAEFILVSNDTKSAKK